jgi:peptide/nickel transport system ATP-binding protein
MERPRSLARLVQLVFQDPYASLHPLHTVDRVLGEVAAIHRFDDPNRRIEAVLKAVGLGPEFRFRFPHQLSGGQRQRVAIARALILEPTILLLDEPTSALDVSVQAEILNLLRRLRAERRLTMLLVTHNLAVVANLCERLAVMRQGRIVETMDAERLRSGGPVHPYTHQLIIASRGYDRANAAEIAVEA